MIIRAITKTEGKLDQYSVYFWGNYCLCLSHHPDSLVGVSSWGRCGFLNDKELQEAAINNTKLNIIEDLINWCDLPREVQKHLERKLKSQ